MSTTPVQVELQVMNDCVGASRVTGLLPVTIYDIECGICEKPFVPPRGTDHVLCRACRRSGARQL